METDDLTGAGPVKPRAAASLTAEIVARGRHRTQEYGEAGLWRGAKAPLPSEAPVRVTFPRSAPEQVDEADEPGSASRLESAAPRKPQPENDPSATAGPTDDLAPLLFVSVALFLAVFFVGLWFF
jgi:hypothetical protein